MEQESLLLDIESEIILEDATVGQRFLNHLVDSVAFCVFLCALLIIYDALNAGSLTSESSSDSIADLLLNLLLLFSFPLYYVLFEGLTKGRTVGKLVTGTKVVNLDGSQITFGTAVLRTLSRLVPFEPFSALSGNPWHDEWTKTRVVKTRR